MTERVLRNAKFLPFGLTQAEHALRPTLGTRLCKFSQYKQRTSRCAASQNSSPQLWPSSWSKRDFEDLKKRVKHFMQSARLQRTGRESDSADDDAPILAPPPESEAWAAEDAAFAADWENASEDGASDEATPAAAPAPAPMDDENDDDDDDAFPEIPGTTI